MKLTLKKILKEGPWHGPGRPGSHGSERHKFHKFPKDSEVGGDYRRAEGGNDFPYVDDKEDLDFSEEAEEVADEESEDDAVRRLMGMMENFLSEMPHKFTQSPSDNTSFHRPPNYGGGAVSHYGKSSKDYAGYDPTSDKAEDDFEDERETNYQGREDSRAKSVKYTDNADDDLEVFESKMKLTELTRGRNLRNMTDMMSTLDVSTNMSWGKGYPHGDGDRDVEQSEKAIEDLTNEKDENVDEKELYQEIKRHLNEISPDPDSDWEDRMSMGQIDDKDDLQFFDKANRTNDWSMSDEDDFKAKKQKQLKKSRGRQTTE